MAQRGGTGTVGKSAAALVVALGGIFAVKNEHLILRSYADPVWGWSVPTACAGDTGPHIKQGMTFTLQQCMDMLKTRHTKLWNQLEGAIDVPLKTHEAVAILSLADNVGTGAVLNSTLLRQVNLGLPPEVWCEQFPRWKYVGKQDCSVRSNKCYGIITRRERERSMCLGDIEGAMK